jgi:D-glycero-alpha-D-manno-heptose-7-phosphate kinase
MIISRTPFRISFFGGGTDYPEWFHENGGKVLTSTINKYCYISARTLPPFFEKKNRIVWSKIETVNSFNDIEHPAVRACLKFLNMDNGMEIHHDGDLPARSGLGSSSAFTVGLLHALYGLKGQMKNKAHLANHAIHVEREVLKEAVGIQDQIAVAFGGLNSVEIHRDGTYNVTPLLLKKTRVNELENHLMLFFTGISRFAFEIAKAQIEAIPQSKAQLHSMAKMVDQALEILNGNGDIQNFGMLLDETWALKRSLSNKISNSTVDHIYDLAMKSGALGGKLLGAGGGGFILFFVPPDSQERVRLSLSDYLEVPFKFEYNGSQIIFCDNNDSL